VTAGDAADRTLGLGPGEDALGGAGVKVGGKSVGPRVSVMAVP
jgi:hypothetical protein